MTEREYVVLASNANDDPAGKELALLSPIPKTLETEAVTCYGTVGERPRLSGNPV